MSKFHSGDIVAIADVPEDLVGKVVQGQPVRIVQTYIGGGAEVLVANLSCKEFPIMLGFLCCLEDSCKARAARWFLSGIGAHRESLAAYEQVVEKVSLDNLEVWPLYGHLNVMSLSLRMQDMMSALLTP